MGDEGVDDRRQLPDRLEDLQGVAVWAILGAQAWLALHAAR